MNTYTEQELNSIIIRICKELGWKHEGIEPAKPYPDDLPRDLQNDTPNPHL